MNAVRVGLQLAQGVMGVVWLLIVLHGADPIPSSPMRRRRFAAWLWVFVFVWWAVMELDRLRDVPRVVWLFTMAGLSCGLLGSLLLMRAPRNGRES